MGRTYIIHYHPLSLRDWIHGHQGFVRSSFGLIAAILAIAIAAPTVTMVRDAVAEHTESLAQGPEVVATTTALPREWRQSQKPITFDHMYRQGDAAAVVEYTRNVHRKYSSE